MIFLIVVWGLAFTYLILQIQYVYYWKKIPVAPPNDIKPTTSPLSSSFQPTTNPEIPVTVVIIARNEQDNIKQCLQGLLAQDYTESLIEILVIDYH